MNITHETNENYTAVKGTSNYLAYNVLLLPSRTALLVIDSKHAKIKLKKKSKIQNCRTKLIVCSFESS